MFAPRKTSAFKRIPEYRKEKLRCVLFPSAPPAHLNAPRKKKFQCRVPMKNPKTKRRYFYTSNIIYIRK